MKATSKQWARNGNVALVIKEAMLRKKLFPHQVRHKLEQNKNNPSIYQWMFGIHPPTGLRRTKLAKILGVSEELLLPNKPVMRPHHTVMLSGPKVPRLPPSVPLQEQVLQFEMDADGNAHIKLDVTLSSRSAIELIAYLRVNDLIR